MAVLVVFMNYTKPTLTSQLVSGFKTMYRAAKNTALGIAVAAPLLYGAATARAQDAPDPSAGYVGQEAGEKPSRFGFRLGYMPTVGKEDFAFAGIHGKIALDSENYLGGDASGTYYSANGVQEWAANVFPSFGHQFKTDNGRILLEVSPGLSARFQNGPDRDLDTILGGGRVRLGYTDNANIMAALYAQLLGGEYNGNVNSFDVKSGATSVRAGLDLRAWFLESLTHNPRDRAALDLHASFGMDDFSNLYTVEQFQAYIGAALRFGDFEITFGPNLTWYQSRSGQLVNEDLLLGGQAIIAYDIDGNWQAWIGGGYDSHNNGQLIFSIGGTFGRKEEEYSDAPIDNRATRRSRR